MVVATLALGMIARQMASMLRVHGSRSITVGRHLKACVTLPTELTVKHENDKR